VRGLHGGTVGVPALVVLARNPWRKGHVARYLGVSQRTVSRYMAEGLPFCKPFGPRGVVCFHPMQVRLWWAQRGARLDTQHRMR
jgi:hypothetical protein